MEKQPRKRGRNFGIVLSASALAVAAGCGPNYSGKGNDFKVDGRVTTAGHRSLTVDVYDIQKEEGQAKGWFEDGVSHQIHDNCNCSGGFWNGNETVGRVLDQWGHEVSPSSVAVGTCVEFDGRIRADQEGKYSHDRPVYNIAQEIPCA